MGQWIMFGWGGLTVGQLRSTSGRGGCQGLGFELYLLLLLEKSSIGMWLLDRRGSPLWCRACMP
jgi:hypothetical protein